MATYKQNTQQKKLIPAGDWEVTVVRGKFNAETVTDKERLKKAGFSNQDIAENDGEIVIEKLTLYMELRGENGEEDSNTETLPFQPNMFWKIDQVRKAFGDDLDGEKEVEIEEDHFDGRTANISVTHKPTKDGKGVFHDIKWLEPKEPF